MRIAINKYITITDNIFNDYRLFLLWGEFEMKINESHRIAALKSSYGKNSGAGASQPGSAKKRDEVSISSEALELLQSQKVSNTERAEKIRELKNSVSTGNYHVEASEIAEKLLPFIR